MNLTIHERHGGGFVITLENPEIILQSPPPARLLPGNRVTADFSTLTLRFGSIDAPPVTFETFSDLQHVLHGEVRLSLERLDP